MKKAVIVFSGYNDRAIIAFLRTMRKHNITYGIIASSKEDLIFSTIYRNDVVVVRNTTELSLPNILKDISTLKIKIKSNEYLIIPSTEALNRFLLKNKRQFNKINCEIPLVNEKLYENVSDKYKFQEICSKNNILVPRRLVGPKKIEIPYVAKPIKYFSKKNKVYKPILVKNITQHNYFLKNSCQSDFYYQEFINGKSLYLLYYFSKDGSIYKLSQENFIQQPGGKSMIAATSSNFHLTQESSKYERLFKNLGFFGLVMIEVRQHKNKNYMIEANPRFWGPSQLFVDTKYNFFEIFLYDNKLINKLNLNKNNILKNVKYFWFGGLVQSLRNDGCVDYHNYSRKTLNKTIKYWLSSDIYFRDDTNKLFIKELIS